MPSIPIKPRPAFYHKPGCRRYIDPTAPGIQVMQGHVVKINEEKGSCVFKKDGPVPLLKVVRLVNVEFIE